jgi:NtrC-family two-component system sensor histidine kinase KinB
MDDSTAKQHSLAHLTQELQSDLKLDSLLYAVLNAMMEGIILIDRDGNVALANPRVDLIGLSPTRIINQPLETLLNNPQLCLAAKMGFKTPDDVRTLVKTRRVPAEPVSYTLEEKEEHITYIQRRIVSINDSAGDPAGLLLMFYDQTEEHELEQTRDDLASMIVHDLRSPLTSVHSGLKLLRDLIPPEIELFPTIDYTAETSQRAIRKLLNRVNSLLDVSRMERGQWMLEREPTRLAPIADHVCQEFTPLARELEVELRSDVNGDLGSLNVDPDKVERVLLNLVDNALKFCPSEGTVTISTHTPQANESGACFVQIDVKDTGPGVPDEYKTKLFERFMQVKGRRGARRGIGLGLTFCRLVVEAHGGRIWIEDNPAGGSIFAFTLPLADKDVDEAE